MFKNYLKIALRNIQKNKLFSAINIAGMTIGMASFFVIAAFVLDELSYDQHNPDKARTYRIYNVNRTDTGNERRMPMVPSTFAPTLQNDFPQIESTLRIYNPFKELLVQVNQDKFLEDQAIFAEPTVFDMLNIELVQGSEVSALQAPYQVVISESLAAKYFPTNQALGKTIQVNEMECVILGVYKDFPQHSHIRPELIASLNTITKDWGSERIDNWVAHVFFTYIKFREEGQAEQLAKELPAFSAKYAHPITKPNGYTYTPRLQRIDDIYLHSSNFEYEMANRSSIYTVYALAGASLFILLIVCVNFINLSTAKSLNRLKEVGVRKVVGARKKDLIFQFLGESVVLALISVVLAGLIAELTTPFLNQITGKDISVQLFSGIYTPLAVVGFAILLGVLAGAYPAFFASSFSSLGIFNKRTAKGPSAMLFRKVSVVIQFALSIFLIGGVIVVDQQLNYLRNKNLGFDKEQILILPIKSNMRTSLDVIKNQWKQNPSIKNLSYSYGLPGQIVAGDEIRNELDKSFPANHILVDYDYIETLGLDILAGRPFSEEYSTDDSNAFIINETAVKNLGFDNPEAAIGQKLNWNMWGFKDSIKHGEVIGVVKDFHFKSLKNALTTTVLHIYPLVYNTVAIKIQPDKVKETVAFLEEEWSRIEPEWPFTYNFLDESFASMYTSEQELGKLLGLFTSLAIFIACMGLFGLVYFVTNQRLREIGIRKVLGAPTMHIAFLLNKSFFFLLLIGFLIAVPVSYMLAINWLDNFAYKIVVSPFIFLMAGGSMIIFALVTVSFQSIKAALTNPVDTLKDE